MWGGGGCRGGGWGGDLNQHAQGRSDFDGGSRFFS